MFTETLMCTYMCIHAHAYSAVCAHAHTLATTQDYTYIVYYKVVLYDFIIGK